VAVNGDLGDEANETFFLNLTQPNGVSIYDSQGTATIIDDDATPSLSIADVSVTEGDAGFVNAVFTLSLSGSTGQGASVRYVTSDGTAVSPADYTAQSGTVTFAPGQTTALVTVLVAGDTINEINETFSLNLTTPTNLNIADSQGVATILDTDPVRQLIIGDITVVETSTGTTNAIFNVGLSQASTLNTTVVYSTANGTATAGADYTATSGTLTFLPGEVLKQITVPVVGDTLNEADETFFVNLINPTNATIIDAQGMATIIDNDPIISLSARDTSLIEGSGTLRNMVFVVDLSVAISQTVTVRYATTSGTAMQNIDFTPRTGILTFAPGQTSQTVSVPIIGDNADENDETIILTLSSPTGGAILADAQAIGTIIDDDPLLTPLNQTEPTSSTNTSTGSASTLTAPTGGTMSAGSSMSGRFAFAAGSDSASTASLASPQPRTVDAALTDDDWLLNLRF
jgi:chitinase